MLEEIKVNLRLPYIGGIEGTWRPNRSQKRAAWEMYVELVTRITVVELRPEEGLLREALSSLHSLFGTTRGIMKKYGPSVAKPARKGDLSFAYLALRILNEVVRPVLAKWNPLLLDFENTRDPQVSQAQHERLWEKSGELRAVLEIVRESLIGYADVLAMVAGIPPLAAQM